MVYEYNYDLLLFVSVPITAKFSNPSYFHPAPKGSHSPNPQPHLPHLLPSNYTTNAAPTPNPSNSACCLRTAPTIGFPVFCAALTPVCETFPGSPALGPVDGGLSPPGLPALTTTLEATEAWLPLEALVEVEDSGMEGMEVVAVRVLAWVGWAWRGMDWGLGLLERGVEVMGSYGVCRASLGCANCVLFELFKAHQYSQSLCILLEGVLLIVPPVLVPEIAVKLCSMGPGIMRVDEVSCALAPTMKLSATGRMALMYFIFADAAMVVDGIGDEATDDWVCEEWKQR